MHATNRPKNLTKGGLGFLFADVPFFLPVEVSCLPGTPVTLPPTVDCTFLATSVSGVLTSGDFLGFFDRVVRGTGGGCLRLFLAWDVGFGFAFFPGALATLCGELLASSCAGSASFDRVSPSTGTS